MVARIGGDEFGVVLPANCDSFSARRMRARFGSGISCSIELLECPIRIRERRNCALSGRRHDRQRASRISRQVNVRAEAGLIGRLEQNPFGSGPEDMPPRMKKAHRTFPSRS